MWLLSFIPDALIQWAVNLVLLTGIAGVVITTLFKFFIKYIPAIIPYRTLIQVISLVLLVAGVYLKGGLGVEMEWRERVRSAEEAVRLAEEKAKEANVALEAEKKKKQQVITQNKVVVQEKIVEKEKIINADCKINKEVIEILNDAAKNPGAKK